MKLIRLTDQRYILDGGPDLTDERAQQISDYFVDWWRRESEVPRVIIVGGSEIPLEYEDRREPDIESRLKALEANVAEHERQLGVYESHTHA